MFVGDHDCVARSSMSRVKRALMDFLCRHTGHVLWRTGSARQNPSGSLELNASICLRCYKGGFVQGDYFKVAMTQTQFDIAVRDALVRAIAENHKAQQAAAPRIFVP